MGYYFDLIAIAVLLYLIVTKVIQPRVLFKEDVKVSEAILLVLIAIGLLLVVYYLLLLVMRDLIPVKSPLIKLIVELIILFTITVIAIVIAIGEKKAESKKSIS